MASPTPNKGYTYPAHGGAVNAWDTPLNDDFDQIDLNVGGVYLITASSTTAAVTFGANSATVPSTATSITPNASNAQNMAYVFTGTISSTMTILFPDVGSFYVVQNQSTSAGTLKVNTTSGTSAVIIAGGGSNLVFTSTYASNSANIVGQLQAKLYTQLGSPNSNVSGTAGSVSGSLTDTVWDTTNRIFYVCTTTGTSATAVWNPISNQTTPQGYLTLSTDASNPIISSDYASKTAVYYSPYNGTWAVVSDGTALYPYKFSQQALSLTAGAHAANSIYDVFMYNSSAGVIIGTGPAWTTATAGSGARGSGAGTTQLARLNGVWTNAVQATLTNGSTTYTCPISQGIYLGSILIDGTAGQVTCHRSYGQNRKWGVWNNYNRQPLYLKGGDATSSWSYASGTLRYSDGSSQNNIKLFCGLAEEPLSVEFNQTLYQPQDTDLNQYSVYIGWDSSSPTGLYGTVGYDPGGGSMGGYAVITAKYLTAPSLGMHQAFCLEQVATVGGATYSLYGTENKMLMTGSWRG